MRPVLVLRPQPGADASVQRARRAGLEAIVYPLFAVEPLAWQSPRDEAFDALMVTSANAVRCAGEGLQALSALPAFAVGSATAQALRERGFEPIATGTADAQSLVHEIEHTSHRNVLHLCGEQVRPVDPGALHIWPVAVYRAPETGDAAGLQAALKGDPVIMVHSPRAGARLAELLPLSHRDGRNVVAISPAAADACGGGWANVTASREPSDAAMLVIVRRICET